MSESKDTPSFFRKMVKFVANPATEWAELTAPSDQARETESAKTELKAMIERKRRNDFVRKRELDMLRRVRREGLSSEQLAALGGSSRIDDSEVRPTDSLARADGGVKAKIDQIEQQMVGDGFAGSQRRAPDFYSAPTQPASMDGAPQATASPPAAAAPPARGGGRVSGFMPTRPGRDPADGPKRAGTGAPAAPPPKLEPLPPAIDKGFSVDVSDVVHDPDLDEAVIAFANADFEQCEHALATLTGTTGKRAQHAETWLVLFDLYRAIGQQHKFESLALDYAQQFGWSAPLWYSMPRMVAEATSDERPKSRIVGQVGWVCPAYVDADVVAKLSSQSLQMPLPWVFDWGSLKGIDAEGCARMSELFRKWIGQKLDMQWLGGERLLTVLQDSSPTGVRDADPAFWQLRLDALRMTNRPDQFDETAIDYCVTYEVSPPSWERAVCTARVIGANHNSTLPPPLSAVTDVSTGFVESQNTADAGQPAVASFDLSGQLVGDISPTLRKMDAELGDSSIVNVSCVRLIRVDFIAAGDLLNWVLARRSENRVVTFLESHRLVALFFGAMGINEHARVKVRTV